MVPRVPPGIPDGLAAAQFTFPQRAGGVEQPVEHPTDLSRWRATTERCQVSIDIIDRACQHIELVVNGVELCAGDHEFLIAQLQLTRTLLTNPVPLPTGLRAELPRSPGRLGGKDPPALLTPRSGAG